MAAPDDSLFFLSARELARRIASRELTAGAVVEAFLERIEAIDPELNAYCAVAAGPAREAAEQVDAELDAGRPARPLAGVPASVKDNIETAGLATTYGSRVFRDNVPDRDAVVVERLKAAGAIVLGKTNLPEFAAKGIVDSPLHGETRNPWSLDRTVGGSSGGAAAAVAAGLGPLAIGNDQAGSVRMPAAFCGVAALKPTAGRIPFHPSEDPWDFIFHVGLIARTVEDLDLGLRLLEGPDAGDPLSLPPIAERWDAELDELARPWRVAWSADAGGAEVDEEVERIAAAACGELEACGAVEAEALDLSSAEEAYATIVPFRRAAAVGERLPEWEAEMDPFVVDYIRGGTEIGPLELGRAVRARTEVLRQVEAALAKHDLVVTPTLAVPPFELGRLGPETVNGKQPRSWRAWFPFTYPFNLTGHPAASVPAGWTADGLPVGVQIVGRRFADREVLAACRQIELRRPWADRRPSLGARAATA